MGLGTQITNLKTNVLDFTAKGWKDLNEFSKENPVRCTVYSIAMKFFALYCMSIQPFGTFILYSNLLASITLLDIPIIINLKEHINNTLQNFNTIFNSRIKNTFTAIFR